MMKKIKQLPKEISDKIAAGEVVTGPVSVIKELTENSIDAGADAITVEIRDGGRTYMRVTDNGSGIPADQVELAFTPHATSKIDSEGDLDNIQTLGFRGEALTSIATVSKLEMITKVRGERVGLSLFIEGGSVAQKKDIGANDGTTIIVRDLYFNTPARLKFMKSDRAESTKIINLISRIAIAYPHIKIRLINNENILFATNGKGDTLQNILLVYGSEKTTGLMEVTAVDSDSSRVTTGNSENSEVGGDAGNDENNNESGYSLKAYISPSSHTNKSRKQQIYFVNGRVVNSKTIENAITRGYQDFVFKDRYPVVFLFLSVDPAKLDVNVHPAKTEVRFKDNKEVSDFIGQSIYNRLRERDAIPDMKGAIRGVERKSGEDIKVADIKGLFETGGKKFAQTPSKTTKKKNKSPVSGEVEQVNIKNLMSAYSENSEAESSLTGNDKSVEQEGVFKGFATGTEVSLMENDESVLNNRVAESSEDSEYKASTGGNKPRDEQKIREKAEAAPNTETSSFNPGGALKIADLQVLGSIFATYILATDEDVFYIIDQHAAHERINYEQFLSQYNSNEKLSQQVLEPLIIDVSAELMSDIESWLAIINKLGYESEVFGEKSVIIRAVPAFLTFAGAEEMINAIFDDMDEGFPQNNIAIEQLIQRACKSSVKANQKLSFAEIKALLADLEKCDNPYACPHGRPVFIKLSKYDVEKLFKRV